MLKLLLKGAEGAVVICVSEGEVYTIQNWVENTIIQYQLAGYLSDVCNV